jgi:hypothetical protein
MYGIKGIIRNRFREWESEREREREREQASQRKYLIK